MDYIIKLYASMYHFSTLITSFSYDYEVKKRNMHVVQSKRSSSFFFFLVEHVYLKVSLHIVNFRIENLDITRK